MAYSDPITIKIGGTSYSLSRIATGNTEGLFVDPTQKVRLTFSPRVTKAGRVSVAARLSITKVVTDPLVATTNQYVDETFTWAFNLPAYGFTTAESIDLSSALTAFLTSTGMQEKLINRES